MWHFSFKYYIKRHLNINISWSLFLCLSQNFAAQMAGGFDEKAGGAQMGVMQGPMVSERWWDLLPLPCFVLFCFLQPAANDSAWMLQSWSGQEQEEMIRQPGFESSSASSCMFTFLEGHKQPLYMNQRSIASNIKTTRWTHHHRDAHHHCSSPAEEIPMQDLKSRMRGNKEDYRFKIISSDL